jgi:hypothetical protein
LLAGCAGVLPDGTTRPEASETTVAASTPVTTPAGAEYPSGFSPTGIARGVAVDRTLSVLEADAIEVVGLERFRPGAYADYRYVANATHARFQLTVHNGYSDISEWDIYTDPAAQYRRFDRNDRPRFDASNRSIAESRAAASRAVLAVLSRILSFGEFRANEAYVSDGDHRIRYELTETAFENATDERGHLIVGDDGLIREARMLYVRSGEPKRFEYTVVRRPGVRIEVPPWLPAAAGG